MIELEAHHINPEHDDFWDPDHALHVVFNDGTEDDFSVPYLWCFMERDEVIKFVIQWNELKNVNLEESQSING